MLRFGVRITWHNTYEALSILPMVSAQWMLAIFI
jgi:hypothetical protein